MRRYKRTRCGHTRSPRAKRCAIYWGAAAPRDAPAPATVKKP